MQGITITDQTMDGFLTVNLIDILQQITPKVLNSNWKIYNLECLGATADELCQICDQEQQISGALLLQLATDITQVIDGKFEAYDFNKTQPWLIITAVDSSAYDVETVDEKILDRLRKQFQQVTDFPSLLTI
ncbi:hypothetical protein [Roseofilum capinflatum]|uniref:Uncharacterized protein n=1 Tax=Roseofilum capinflatum BLCC-M114 TaxID=3022440 RepID=A0ABT7B4I9_9CYAN|nr:hypothetical protein [Roseofilum capinflatum]MDJ1174085.1 hypothetical protein [Roseofilum capinflatum BLCC-M114]